MTLVRADPQQYQPGHRLRLSEHQIAKILVFGKQQTVLISRATHHGHIAHLRRDFRNIDDIMSELAELPGKRGVDTFIEQPAHATSPVDQLLIGEIVGGKGLSGANVVDRHSRMVLRY